MKKSHAYNYRSVIKSEFAARQQLNPSYSLRAFARSLGVSPTMISQIIAGKRAISKKSALTIAEGLKLSPYQRSQFLLSAVGEEIKSPLSMSEKPDFVDLEADRFQIISDWYHFAILSLEDIPGHRWCADWIAERLEISSEMAQAAMERLLRLGLVEVQGTSFKQTQNVITQSPTPSEAIQSYHRQSIQKALQSLDQDPPGNRDFSSITMAINPRKIEACRELIRKFREDMYSMLDSGPKNERVYSLNIQLFPISKK